MDMFEKWNSNVDLNGLQKDIKDAQENKREYEEIPHGEYEVKVDKMELKSSKKGDPMVSIWFTILEGKYKKSKLFLNQVITQGFQVHIVNELLRSMKTDLNKLKEKEPECYEGLIADYPKVTQRKGYVKITVK